MNTKPHVTNYLDDEERELVDAIEAEDYEPSESLMTPQLLEELQQAARNTMSETSEKISIRLPRTDLARVKAKALREGVPYQTLLKSIIHQAVRR